MAVSEISVEMQKRFKDVDVYTLSLAVKSMAYKSKWILERKTACLYRGTIITFLYKKKQKNPKRFQGNKATYEAEKYKFHFNNERRRKKRKLM